MALEKSLEEQAVGVIDEYLAAADICIRTTKAGGGILGYPAVLLLLLCATDAIGHGVLPWRKRAHIRLDVLATTHFGSVLSPGQVNNLKDWYRNPLTHKGRTEAGVYLEPDACGQPFEFDASPRKPKLVLIRVGSLYEVVRKAWGQVDKATFCSSATVNSPPTGPDKPPRGGIPADVASASGLATIPGQPGGKAP